MENIKLLNSKFRMLAVALLGIALMLIMAPKAKAQTYNVSNSSACTLQDAFNAVNTGAASGSCLAGDPAPTMNTITLAPETFTLGSILPVSNGASLTLVGAGPGQTIIDGAGSYNINIQTGSTSNYIFSGFTIQNTDGSPINVEFLSGGGSGSVELNSLIVRNNIKCTSRLCVSIGNKGEGTVNVSVSRSSFYGNSSNLGILGLINPSTSGILISSVVNNTFSENTGTAIETYSTSSGDSKVSMINNTIVDNQFTDSSTAGAFGIFAGNVAFELTNNVLSGNTSINCPNVESGVVSNGGNISSDDSCSSYFNQTNDKNNTPPLLQAAVTDDGYYVYPITNSSPAYNNGISNGAPATDQRGVSRPQAAAFDSGAYELIVSTPAPTPTPSNNGSLASTGNDARIPLAIAILLVSIGTVGSVIAFKRR